MSAKIVAIMGIICEVAEMALWIVASFIKFTVVQIGAVLLYGEKTLPPQFTYGPAAVCGLAVVLYILAFLAEQKQNNTFFLIFLIVMGLRVIGSGVNLGLFVSFYIEYSAEVGKFNQKPALKGYPNFRELKTPIFFLILLIAAGIFFLVRAVFYFLIFRAYRAFKSGDRVQTQAEMTDGYADNEQMA